MVHQWRRESRNIEAALLESIKSSFHPLLCLRSGLTFKLGYRSLSASSLLVADINPVYAKLPQTSLALLFFFAIFLYHHLQTITSTSS